MVPRGGNTKVFGLPEKSFYGKLVRLNHSQPNVQQSQSDNIYSTLHNIVNTTDFNREPEVLERIFHWIDDHHLSKKTISDEPFEIVIIGVGNSIETGGGTGAPQLIEILAILSMLKHCKINITLIDFNQESLRQALLVSEYILDSYLKDKNSFKKELDNRLYECIKSVSMVDKISHSYRFDIDKIKHIKLNGFCADLHNINFPSHSADLIITTNTLIYMDKTKLKFIFQNILLSLKDSGRFITSEGFEMCEPELDIVANLPIQKDCQRNKIYLSPASKENEVAYCYYSHQKDKIIIGSIKISQYILTSIKRFTNNIEISNNEINTIKSVDWARITEYFINNNYYNKFLKSIMNKPDLNSYLLANNALFFTMMNPSGYVFSGKLIKKRKRENEDDNNEVSAIEVTARKKKFSN